jgi:predicted AAA+ superfamily ATPase
MKHNKTAVLSSLQRKYDRNDNKQAERCDCVFTMSSIQRKIKRKQKQQHKRKERIRSQYVSSLTLML